MKWSSTNQVSNFEYVGFFGIKHPFLEARYKPEQLAINAMFDMLSHDAVSIFKSPQSLNHSLGWFLA
jgi:hypothetical protein